jgi:salicylate hydroxylase
LALNSKANDQDPNFYFSMCVFLGFALTSAWRSLYKIGPMTDLAQYNGTDVQHALNGGGMAAQGRLRVVIAGAGVGGLTAALALAQRGFIVEVFEQASELREVGAGVLITPNGMRVFQELGIADQILEVGAHSARRLLRLWNTGQTWTTFDLGAAAIEMYGQPFAWLYRPDLLSVLEQAFRSVAPGAIHLRRKVTGCTNAEQGVKLHFSDGSNVSGDALIGADGIHSAIRATLYGSDTPEFTGLVAWRGIIPMSDLPEHVNSQIAASWVGPGRSVTHYPVRRGDLLNFGGVVERDTWRLESWSSTGSREQMEADFAGWHSDVRTMIRAIPQPYVWALLVRRPLPRWSVGRLTLLGDACHPMLPHMGQGATMAIEDAFILARAMQIHAPNVTAALSAYEAARKDRTTRLVNASAEGAKRFNNPTLGDPVGAQAYIEREFAEPRLRERYDWIYRYDVMNVAL